MYYVGNAIRYDLEIGDGAMFRVDIQNPWEHQPLAIGSKAYVSFPVKTTLAIPV
jgi:hypothetical protein